MNTIKEVISFLREPDCMEQVEACVDGLPVLFTTGNGDDLVVLSTYYSEDDKCIYVDLGEDDE